MRTDAASICWMTSWKSYVDVAINQVIWVLVSASVSYKLPEWTGFAKNFLLVCNLQSSIGLKPLDHGPVTCWITCITAAVSIWVLTVVQLSFSSIFHWSFSLLFCFSFICPSWQVWTKVHWAVLAAHWFFNFQAVKLTLFDNSFARGYFFLL